MASVQNASQLGANQLRLSPSHPCRRVGRSGGGASPGRIDQAIDNLVVNALRYVPDGGTMELRAMRGPRFVSLLVIDSGTGIPPEHLDRVFDRFYKVDAARVAGGAGSGLGLSIVKAIVDRHGGSVGVTSRPGRTEFKIVLPQADHLGACH